VTYTNIHLEIYQHNYATRGHDFILQKIRAIYDLRKYYSTNRVVNMWNSLSSYVVSEESVKLFQEWT